MELGIPFPISVGRLWYQTFKNIFLSTTRMPSIQDVGICGHMLAFYIQPAPPFLRAMVLCQRLPAWKNGLLSWHIGQIPSRTWRRSATTQSTAIRDCRSARFNCLLWIYRTCLSNSDIDIQSVGYNSAQSPTNWESIHGEDPSILCQLSSRLSIALDDKKLVGWYKKLVPIFLIQNVQINQRICYQHNYNFFRTKDHAWRPEIWDVPDWFPCMCKFQVSGDITTKWCYVYTKYTHILYV